jgi:hypothetical protein
LSAELALRLCEIGAAIACMQQSAEHLAGPRDERRLFALRLVFALALAAGLASGLSALALALLSALALRRFRGPYNRGSDRMTLLALACISIARLAPSPHAAELALGYLALQLLLSYFVSGVAKLASAEWRAGRALIELFAVSSYPASESLRGLARYPRALALLGYATLFFELAFPLALVDARALAVALVAAASFHLANAALLGLNRFVWAWLAAFPALIWLQGRVEVALSR